MSDLSPNQSSADNYHQGSQQDKDYGHYRQLGLLLTLYFAQGLPAGFITQALPAILREYQASLVAIGWSGLILLPWGLKFLWSPWVDAHYRPTMGRSRSWILPLQLGSIIVLAVIAFFEPQNLSQANTVITLYALLFVLSLMGATHDIATDGLATRLLKRPILTTDPISSDIALTPPDNASSVVQSPVKHTNHEQQRTHRHSQGNAVQAIGYRMGLILGGGVLLMALDVVGWRASFLIMAGLVGLNTLPILRFREPATVTDLSVSNYQMSNIAPVAANTSKRVSVSIASILTYIQHHYQYFWSTKELRAWLGVLLVFKIADGLSSGMVKPMMVDFGVSLNRIGFWVTILGSAASLMGAGVATLLMKRLTRYQALLGFNLLQALTTGLYGAVAYGFYHGYLQQFAWLYAINALEHFCASLALVAMLTTIMHYARTDRAGSDFTVQVCLLTALGGSAHFVGGYTAKLLGYTAHFSLSLIVGMLCLVPIILWHKTQNKEK